AAGCQKLVTSNAVCIALIGSVNGNALFGGYDAEHGRELWISDGTVAGTHFLKDVQPGPQAGWPNSFREINGITYFLSFAGRDANNDYGHPQIWRTDGTEAGTVLVTDLAQYPEAEYYVKILAVEGK